MSKLYGAERVAQIRAKLKEKYPYIKFSIAKDGYNGVNIRILEAPIDFSDKENQKAKETLEDIENIASEGVTYRETGDYGNQPDFYVWVRVGSYDKPFVYKPSAIPTTSVGGTRKPFTRGASAINYDKGALVFECDSGWKVYKKTLPDNRIVYNAIKDKDVASNKNDWNAIKGEVYVEAGFKWGRFGAFERWGEIDDVNVFTKLCAVLSKYYKKTSQSTPAVQTPTPTAPPTPQPAQPEPAQVQREIVYVDTSIPTNPKLQYCEIVWAEGDADYSDLFPMPFSSFTQLTKFIADNIGELPTVGYDKHKVRWKWKELSEPMEERWDISERGANPFKYPNLFASEVLKEVCYDAWKKEDANRTNFGVNDYVFTETIGKDGFELSDSQFNTIINECLTLYPSDNKRFEYNTATERLERFKQVYPKLYALFNQPPQSQGDVEQETRNLLRSLELIRGDGTNKDIEQLIRALRLILK